MKLISKIIAAIALTSAPSAFAQLAVTDSGRLTTGIEHTTSPFKANDTLESAYDQDFLMIGYKLASKERFLIGGGVGLVLNGVIQGEQEQKFSDAEGQRLFLQGQYGVTKFGDSNFLYADINVTRDQFTYHQPDIDVNFNMLNAQIGMQMVHRFESLFLYHSIHFSAFYKGRAEIIIPQLGVLKYKVSRPTSVQAHVGLGYRIDPSMTMRVEIGAPQEMSAMFALDFKI